MADEKKKGHSSFHRSLQIDNNNNIDPAAIEEGGGWWIS